MTRSFFTHFAVVALIAAFSMPLLTTNEAAAKTCKGYYNSGLGKLRFTRTGARQSARSAWRKKVRAYHGVKWGSWTIAANKHYDWCNRHSNGKWHCEALARACKPF